MTIPSESVRFRRGDAVHTRAFDAEFVILDLAKGEYYALDEIGGLLWSGLEAGQTLEQIAHDVGEWYEVSVDQAAADLRALLDDLVARGLLLRESADDRNVREGRRGR